MPTTQATSDESSLAWTTFTTKSKGPVARFSPWCACALLLVAVPAPPPFLPVVGQTFFEDATRGWEGVVLPLVSERSVRSSLSSGREEK